MRKGLPCSAVALGLSPHTGTPGALRGVETQPSVGASGGGRGGRRWACVAALRPAVLSGRAGESSFPDEGSWEGGLESTRLHFGFRQPQDSQRLTGKEVVTWALAGDNFRRCCVARTELRLDVNCRTAEVPRAAGIPCLLLLSRRPWPGVLNNRTICLHIFCAGRPLPAVWSPSSLTWLLVGLSPGAAIAIPHFWTLHRGRQQEGKRGHSCSSLSPGEAREPQATPGTGCRGRTPGLGLTRADLHVVYHVPQMPTDGTAGAQPVGCAQENLDSSEK